MIDNQAERRMTPGTEWANGSPAPNLARAELLRGCNLYHHASVMRQAFDPGWLAGVQIREIGPDFIDGFFGRFQSLRTIVPGGTLEPDFVARIQADQEVSLEETLLQAICSVECAILSAAHTLDRVDFATLVQGENQEQVVLVWETFSAKLSRLASAAAFAGLVELLPQSIQPELAISFEESLASLVEQAQKRRLSPTSSVLKQAAKRRGLPVQSITGQHLRLGQGARQHQIYSSMTGFTSISATKLAVDKRQTNRRLRELRLPVPEQIRVGDLEEAKQAAAELGLPVVIKPMRGSRGGGVTAGLDSEDEISPAFERAEASGTGVLVERFVPGVDHRMLVVGDRFVAALIRMPPTITGDGVRTVHALIDDLNADPYRDGFRLFPIELDESLEDMLRQQGYGLTDVLAAGVEVALRTTSNVSTGGIPIDVTDRVHPDNRRMAEAAAKGIGLDVAGVDFITTDIARSHKEIGGGIVEVNARPGLCMHTWPRRGAARDVAGSILELVFPVGDTGSVPRILIAGDRGTGAMARAVEYLLRCADITTGLCLRDQVYLGGQALDVEDARLRQTAKVLLKEPSLEAFVAAVSLRRTVRYGLQLDVCDAVAVLPPSLDGNGDIFCQGVDIVAKANRGKFVLWSADAVSRQALAVVAPDRLLLVATQSDDDVAAAHLASGGTAIMPRWDGNGSGFTLFDQGVPVLSSPLTSARGARRPLNARDVETRMFAVALAYASGVEILSIERALTNPGPYQPIASRQSRPLIPPIDRRRSDPEPSTSYRNRSRSDQRHRGQR